MVISYQYYILDSTQDCYKLNVDGPTSKTYGLLLMGVGACSDYYMTWRLLREQLFYFFGQLKGAVAKKEEVCECSILALELSSHKSLLLDGY